MRSSGSGPEMAALPFQVWPKKYSMKRGERVDNIDNLSLKIKSQIIILRLQKINVSQCKHSALSKTQLVRRRFVECQKIDQVLSAISNINFLI